MDAAAAASATLVGRALGRCWESSKPTTGAASRVRLAGWPVGRPGQRESADGTQKVSTHPINTRNGFGGGFIGDYTTVAVGSDNMFHAFWTDTNNKQNVVWFYGLERLSARSVFGPKMPSAVSPWAPWKPATACLVAGP